MVVIPGIVTAASKSNIKAIKMVVRCSNCGHEKDLKGGYGYVSTTPPRVCDNQKNPGVDKENCRLDSYRVVPEKCKFVD